MGSHFLVCCAKNKSPALCPVDGSGGGGKESTADVGHPRLWSGSASALEKYKTAQRVSAVMMPSSKVLLWDEGYLQNEFDEKPYFGIRTPMLFADQSVRSEDPSLATEIVVNPFRNSVVREEKLHNTRDGVQGVDFQP